MNDSNIEKHPKFSSSQVGTKMPTWKGMKYVKDQLPQGSFVLLRVIQYFEISVIWFNTLKKKTL